MDAAAVCSNTRHIYRPEKRPEYSLSLPQTTAAARCIRGPVVTGAGTWLHVRGNLSLDALFHV